MWRSLFFACGIVLVMLGLECIVVGRFTLSREARLPEFVEDMFNESGKGQLVDSGGFNGSNIRGDMAPPQSIQGYGGVPSSASRFGPSRFSGSQFGNDQFFGGSNTSAQRSNQVANPAFSLAGYSNNSQDNLPVLSSPNKPLKTVETRDWMPWSLIAAGTIIVLYTKSHTRHDSDGGG